MTKGEIQDFFKGKGKEVDRYGNVILDEARRIHFKETLLRVELRIGSHRDSGGKKRITWKRVGTANLSDVDLRDSGKLGLIKKVD